MPSVKNLTKGRNPLAARKSVRVQARWDMGVEKVGRSVGASAIFGISAQQNQLDMAKRHQKTSFELMSTPNVWLVAATAAGL